MPISNEDDLAARTNLVKSKDAGFFPSFFFKEDKIKSHLVENSMTFSVMRRKRQHEQFEYYEQLRW